MLVFTDTPAQVPVSLQQQQSLSGAIEEYERQVNGPEARQQLQKLNPSLVAERDRAIVELRRERIQKELVARVQSSRSLHR